MGKAGKERKRRKLESQNFVAIDDNDDDADDSDGEGADEQEGTEAGSRELSLLLPGAIEFLDASSQRIDLYRSKDFKALRQVLFPLIELQTKKSAHFEIKCLQSMKEDKIDALLTSKASMSAMVRAATMLNNSHTHFFSAELKEFRHALHPFVLLSQQKDGNASSSRADGTTVDQGGAATSASYSQRISSAFRANNWHLALKELHAMRVDGTEKPKLGTIQRWVRDCDLARMSNHTAEGENLCWLLLDATMRLQGIPSSCNSGDSSGGSSDSSGVVGDGPVPTVAVVTRHPVFCTSGTTAAVTVPSQTRVPTAAATAGGDRGNPTCTSSSAVTSKPAALTVPSAEFIRSRLSVLLCVPGPQRRPPSTIDLNIYQLAPGTMTFDHLSGHAVPAPRRLDVPSLPSVFLMENILSRGDCRRLIAAAEAIGYVPDAADGIDNIQLYADDSLLLPVFDRCRALLPPTLVGGGGAENRLVGINARWRLFRYYENAVYRPHIDGAWPGSGLDPQTGEFVDDIHVGACVSKLTFLIYLNGADSSVDDNNTGEENSFEGGWTTFYQPSGVGLGCVDARSVQPRTGAVLCFAHGDTGSLVHEGSAVVGESRPAGAIAKYVVRTDVIYTCSTSS